MANYFEGEISESAKHLDWFISKLAVPTGKNRKWLKRPPFDFIAGSGGESFGIEAKSNRFLGSFPLERLEPHQYIGLHKFRDECGEAFILINYRAKLVAGKRRVNNIAYAIRIRDWDKVRHHLAEIGRKSIPVTMLTSEHGFIPIPRVKIEDKLIWDLRVLKKSTISTTINNRTAPKKLGRKNVRRKSSA